MRIFRTVYLIAACLLFFSCGSSDKNDKLLHIATSAEYPPFEYVSNGKLIGYDIALGQLIAKELGKTAVFDNMQFSMVLPALLSKQDDLAIATLTITSKRKENFDFSKPYYHNLMAVVYSKQHPIPNLKTMQHGKISAQLGSVMDLWLREKLPPNQVISFNNNHQAIEALLAHHVEAILMDKDQAVVYCQKHAELAFNEISEAHAGYGIATMKGSPLSAEVDNALKKLIQRGDLKKLQATWIGGETWPS